MYLSKVFIDWKWVKDPYQLHRALWQLFPNRPDETRDFLFRVEDFRTGQGAYVLLQSEQKPQDSSVAQIIASKEILFKLTEGMTLRFRLRANPIKTIKDEQKRLDRHGQIKRCRVPLIREEQQLQWLQRKLSGAAILESASLIQESSLYFQKQGKEGKICPVSFEGILAVNETHTLYKLISQGIGPAKSMGCGLLSLAAV